MEPLTFERRVTLYTRRGEGFPDRREFLRFLATGPDNRRDVQAARNLLMKDRYNGGIYRNPS